MTKYTVHFYDRAAKQILRTSEYTSRAAAQRAMERARKRGQCSAYAGTRTANDPPTVHH